MRARHETGSKMAGAPIAPGGAARSVKSIGVLMNLGTFSEPDGVGAPSGTFHSLMNQPQRNDLNAFFIR